VRPAGMRCCFCSASGRPRTPGASARLRGALGGGSRTCPPDLPGRGGGGRLPEDEEGVLANGRAGARCPEGEDEECARRLQVEYDREAEEKAARARFKCPLCLETASFDESVELDCLHRVCRDCLSGYVEVKIREKRLAADELCCPMPACGAEITVPQVEGLTRGTPQWERFLAGRAELWRPGEHEPEVLVVCPTPDCTRFVAAASASEVECPRCHQSFCPRCLCGHPGRTCAEHEAWRRANEAGDRAFEELMREKQWQRCPRCGAPVERARGCNFMTCASERCRGKTHFCYLCGAELTRTQHISHFPRGPFSSSCAAVDRRGEATLPPRASCQLQGAWADLLGDLGIWAVGGDPRRPGAEGGA